MRERESKIEKYLVDQVEAAGGECRKVKWINRRHAPDRLVMLGGDTWVEVKRPGEEPRPGQVREHERMRRLGSRVEVVDTREGVDALVSALNA